MKVKLIFIIGANVRKVEAPKGFYKSIVRRSMECQFKWKFVVVRGGREMIY